MRANLITLANQHRRDLNAVSTAATRDWFTLTELANREARDSKGWARILRAGIPQIARNYGSTSAQIAGAFYDASRNDWIEIYGLKIPKRAAQPGRIQKVLDSKIVEPTFEQIGYYIGKVVEGQRNRATIRTETAQIIQRAAYDGSRLEIEEELEADNFSEEPVRIVRGAGCDYCKTQVVIMGADAEAEKFHKGCSCIKAPTFQGGEPVTQAWEDDFKDEYNKAREHLKARKQIMQKRQERSRSNQRVDTSEFKESHSNVLKQMRLDRRGKKPEPANEMEARLLEDW